MANSRAGVTHGFYVEMLEGDGFVAVRKTEKPPVRQTTQAASAQGKRQVHDADGIASARDLAARES